MVTSGRNTPSYPSGPDTRNTAAGAFPHFGGRMWDHRIVLINGETIDVPNSTAHITGNTLTVTIDGGSTFRFYYPAVAYWIQRQPRGQHRGH